jgi:hypothetical protein
MSKTKNGKSRLASGSARTKGSKSAVTAEPQNHEALAALHPALSGLQEGNDALSAFDALGEEELVVSNLLAADRQLLARVARFLFGITAPRLLRRAVRAGYTKEEHAELWILLAAAAGRKQTLETHFALAGQDSGSGERGVLLQEIDAFENLWFPRTRAIIARLVPDAEVFLEGFFRNLAQQPLGPLVIDSVTTFLDRVIALDTSSQVGAKDVRATLRARGLTDTVIKEMQQKLERARRGTSAATAAVDEASVRAAQVAQSDALRALRRAWNDWATTLRPLFDAREQVILGLTELRRHELSESEPTTSDGASSPSPAALPPSPGAVPQLPGNA